MIIKNGPPGSNWPQSHFSYFTQEKLYSPDQHWLDHYHNAISAISVHFPDCHEASVFPPISNIISYDITQAFTAKFTKCSSIPSVIDLTGFSWGCRQYFGLDGNLTKTWDAYSQVEINEEWGSGVRYPGFLIEWIFCWIE